jgi:hypothetical protein
MFATAGCASYPAVPVPLNDRNVEFMDSSVKKTFDAVTYLVIAGNYLFVLSAEMLSKWRQAISITNLTYKQRVL